MPELATDPLAPLTLTIDSRAKRGDFDATEVAPLVDTMRRAHAEITAARRDGSKSALEEAIARGTRGIDAFAHGSGAVAERFASAEARALGTPKVDDARAVEIRAWASGKSAVERGAIYLRAIDDGDLETVAAFETAPKSFGLLDDVDPERARTRKLAALPAETRAEFDAMQRRIAGYAHVTDVARRELRDWAGSR